MTEKSTTDNSGSTKNAYGMEDYSDVTPMTREQAQVRRKRSVAIAAVLGFLILLFYITTITRLSENIKKISAAKKAAVEMNVPVKMSVFASVKPLGLKF